MEVPLVLRAAGENRLVYAVSPWFRGSLVLCALLLSAAMVLGEGPAGAFAWILLALSLLGALYEERWTLDAGSGELVHRYGLLLLARSLVLPLERVASFRIAAWVSGTVPGSADEAGENAAALAGDSPDNPRRRRREPHKRAWIQLRVVDLDGAEYLLDTLPSRRGAGLKDIGMRLASLAGKPLVEG